MKAEEEEGERGGEGGEEEEEGEGGNTDGERGGDDGDDEGEVKGEGDDLRLQSGVERRENAPESMSDEREEEEEEWQPFVSSSSTSSLVLLSSSFFNLLPFPVSSSSSLSCFSSCSSLSAASLLSASGARKSSSNLAITSSAVNLSFFDLLPIMACLPPSSSQMSDSWEDLALPSGFLLFDDDDDNRGLGEEEYEGSCILGDPALPEWFSERGLLDCLLLERLRRERALVLGKERRPWRGRSREDKEDLLLLVCCLLPISILLLLLLVCCLMLSKEERLTCLLPLLTYCFSLVSCLLDGRVSELGDVLEEMLKRVGRRERLLVNCCLEEICLLFFEEMLESLVICLEEREERDRECCRGRRRGDGSLRKKSLTHFHIEIEIEISKNNVSIDCSSKV